MENDIKNKNIKVSEFIDYELKNVIEDLSSIYKDLSKVLNHSNSDENKKIIIDKAMDSLLVINYGRLETLRQKIKYDFD